MKKWIGLTAGIACLLSSSLSAEQNLVAVETIESGAIPETLAADEQAPKQVGKASADSINSAKKSNTAKYVLAASAVAIGTAAIILVSRHHGHHHHHHHSHSK
jgi:hypothetical protein